MGNDIFSRIGVPYDRMLKSLENVEGYGQFVKFIEDRADVNNDWKAEIKAVFEINKKGHPLISISSQDESEPEGIFKINDEVGIIEAAFIRYVYNEEQNKVINRVKNWLSPLSKQLTGRYEDYEISVFIFSIDDSPTDEELKHIKENLVDSIRNGDNNFFRNCSPFLSQGV